MIDDLLLLRTDAPTKNQSFRAGLQLLYRRTAMMAIYAHATLLLLRRFDVTH